MTRGIVENKKTSGRIGFAKAVVEESTAKANT